MEVCVIFGTFLWAPKAISDLNPIRTPCYPCRMPSQTAPPQPTLHPPKPLRENLAAEFALDPSIAFLNHGSFGARPRQILESQNKRRAEFEARPIEWLDRRRHDMIEAAKQKLGSFIGMTPANFGFVTNATGGINAVLRSLTFNPGDELLTTNHVYNAVRKTMKYLAAKVPGGGAKYIEVAVPFPVASPEQIIRAIESAITPRTRILVVDHITSPTAVIFPIKQIIDLCTSRNVDVIIDGAHAPGMIPLNVEELGAAYYAGNLHKWTCAPLGSAFLWVRPDKQTANGGIHPTTISHFLDENFINEFNWQGTRDITPWLCIQDSLAWFEGPGLGWDRVMKHNHQMAVWVQQMLCDRWQVEPSTPMRQTETTCDAPMIGSMTTVLLPSQAKLHARFADFQACRQAIYDQHRIEVPVVEFPMSQANPKSPGGSISGNWYVRPCCQIYNTPEQYERLATAVLDLIG